MSKPDPLEEFRNVPRPETKGPWDRTFVREAVRHIARNCDWIEADDPDFSWHKSGDWEAIAALPDTLDKLDRLAEIVAFARDEAEWHVRDRIDAMLRGEA